MAIRWNKSAFPSEQDTKHWYEVEYFDEEKNETVKVGRYGSWNSLFKEYKDKKNFKLTKVK